MLTVLMKLGGGGDVIFIVLFPISLYYIRYTFLFFISLRYLLYSVDTSFDDIRLGRHFGLKKTNKYR